MARASVVFRGTVFRSIPSPFPFQIGALARLNDDFRLSVVIPTYDGSAFLASALESVAEQYEPGLEVVIVDDGSHDGTLEIARSFGARMPVEIHELPHSGNWVGSTNRAIGAARGEWVTCLHQDDLWLPGRLAALKRAVAAVPSAVLIFHSSRFIDSRGRNLGTWRAPLPPFPRVLHESEILPRLLVQNFISMPSPMFRRSAAIGVGGMDESLWYTADWDFWLKLVHSGAVSYIARPLTAFRVHRQSQTIQRGHAQEIRDQLEKVFDRHWSTWDADPLLKTRVRQLAELSTELNVLLAGRWEGLAQRLGRFLKLGFRVPPAGWLDFFRDTRIGERLLCRAVALARPTPVG
jgi:glycosyltransferase involved in cell wall biosynthesis